MGPFKRLILSLAALPWWILHRVIRPFRPTLTRVAALGEARAVLGPGVPASTQFDGRIRIAGTGAIRLGESCRLGEAVFLETTDSGRIDLGDRVRVNRGTVISASCRIQIGSDTLIGEYVSIRDQDHGTAPGRPIQQQPMALGPVSIGANVWIGRGVAVLRGVTIGENAVIGANSVVAADVPPDSVAVGAPARVVRQRDARDRVAG